MDSEPRPHLGISSEILSPEVNDGSHRSRRTTYGFASNANGQGPEAPLSSPSAAPLGFRMPARAGGTPRAPGLVTSRISSHRFARIELVVGPRDVRIHRRQSIPDSVTTAKLQHHRESRPRGIISKFSPASRRRLLFTARNSPSLRVLVTLTYPEKYPLDGAVCKEHLRQMIQWCKRQGAECGIWILEFQKRGAPHFHLFTEGYLHFLEVRKA